MTIVEWFKTLWPVVAILGAFGIRLEVGQALNKQRLRTIEKDIERENGSRKEDVAAIHARVSRHETDIGSRISEIQQDIKTLLARQ